MKSINQDLLSGKACNKIEFGIMLDEDPDLGGSFPVDKDKQQQHIEESISFLSEPTNLYLIEIKLIDSRKYRDTIGYGLWHKQLIHSTNQTFKQTIIYSKG